MLNKGILCKSFNLKHLFCYYLSKEASRHSLGYQKKGILMKNMGKKFFAFIVCGMSLQSLISMEKPPELTTVNTMLDKVKKSGIFTTVSALPADKQYLLASGIIGIVTLGGATYYYYQSGKLEKISSITPFLLGSLGVIGAAHQQGLFTDAKSSAAIVGLATLFGSGLQYVWNRWTSTEQEYNEGSEKKLVDSQKKSVKRAIDNFLSVRNARLFTTALSSYVKKAKIDPVLVSNFAQNPNQETLNALTDAFGIDNIKYSQDRLKGGAGLIKNDTQKRIASLSLQEFFNDQDDSRLISMLQHMMGQDNYELYQEFINEFISNPDQVKLNQLTGILGIDPITIPAQKVSIPVQEGSLADELQQAGFAGQDKGSFIPKSEPLSKEQHFIPYSQGETAEIFKKLGGNRPTYSRDFKGQIPFKRPFDPSCRIIRNPLPTLERNWGNN